MRVVIASAAGEGTLALTKEPSVDGKVEYKDRARAMGVAANPFLNLSAWSILVLDFNNDGFNDVFIAAGHLEPDPDVAKVSQGQPKQLLLNSGNGYFTDAATSAGIALQDAQSARGSVSADFDNDGDVDLYVVNNNDLGQYLVNESPKRHWLGLKLIGTKSNRDGIGAIVRLTASNSRQMKTVVSGEGFLSDSDKRIVFGLGDATGVEKIMIHWPSGHQQTLRSVQADRYWQVEENRDNPRELPDAVAINASSRKLRLKLGVDQAEIRTRYVRMLGQSEESDEVGSELTIAAEDSDAPVRREVLAAASRMSSAQGLSLLIHGLEDVETANVIAAIEGLRRYEDETAVRWLLRLFSHQEPAVKIAVADCFGFFFQEEEAVVHRKYLAVPYLIRLLDDAEPKVRIAAARALAGAERFRGVHSLLDHLDDPDPAARAEFVRSLGLIRQAQALPELQRLVSNAHQSAHAMANSFIALKRLGDETVLKTLTAFVMGQDGFGAVPLEKRLDVFADLWAQDNEVAVFDPEQLKQLAHAAFDKFPPAAKDLDLTLRWISVRQHITDQADANWLDRQTHATQSHIRASAFSAVFLQRRAELSSFLRRAWSDQEPAIKQWALKELLREKVALSMDDYRKILADPELRSFALQFWSKTLPSTEPSMLLNALKLERENKYSGGQSAKEAAVQQLSKSPKKGQSAKLEALCFNTDDWQAFCPLILFSHNTPEHRSMAAKLLRDPTYPVAIRQAILNHYGSDFDTDAMNVVYAVAQVKKDPLRDAAINKLFSFKSEALIEFAEKTARDVTEKSGLRFQALEFLMQHGRPEAREILYR